MKNKINVGIIVSIIFIILIIGIIIYLGKDKKKDVNSDYNLELINIGKEYYKQVFFPTIDNPVLVIQPFTEIGLNFSLSTLNEYKEFNENLTKYLTKNNCSYEDSKIFIYPQSPFKVNDFEIELHLECK